MHLTKRMNNSRAILFIQKHTFKKVSLLTISTGFVKNNSGLYVTVEQIFMAITFSYFCSLRFFFLKSKIAGSYHRYGERYA